MTSVPCVAEPEIEGIDPRKPWAAVGARVREARESLGLSQREFAALAGVAERTLQTHEAGERSPHRKLLNYSTISGRSLDWFYGVASPTGPDPRVQTAAERRVALSRVRRMEKEVATLLERLRAEAEHLEDETG